MTEQNSSGFQILITTSTSSPSAVYENIGYIWYETDTEKIKTITESVSGIIIKEIG